MTNRTEYQHDEDGNVTGTTTTTDVQVQDADGKTVAEGHQTQKCDADGQNCSSPYINPDADDNRTLTPEMVESALRNLGSNVTTLPGWTAPGDETPRDPQDPRTIMLVDGDLYDAAILADVPRLTGAQPESRPDLPSPLDAADPKGPGGPRAEPIRRRFSRSSSGITSSHQPPGACNESEAVGGSGPRSVRRRRRLHREAARGVPVLI